MCVLFVFCILISILLFGSPFLSILEGKILPLPSVCSNISVLVIRFTETTEHALSHSPPVTMFFHIKNGGKALIVDHIIIAGLMLMDSFLEKSIMKFIFAILSSFLMFICS